MPQPDSQLSTGGGNTSSSSFLSVASALSQPVGSLLSSVGNYFLNERRNEQAIEQWKRENEYNLPKNQIARLRDAGLNPALMYGEGASGLVSAASPDMTKSNLSVAGIDPLTAAQIANLNAQTQATTDANARANELQPFNIQNVKANNDVLAQKVKNMTAEEQLAWSNKAFVDVQRAVTDKQCDELIKLWNSQSNLNKEMRLKTNEETRQLIVLYNLRRQGIVLTNKEIESRIHVNEADANRLIKLLDVMDSEIRLNASSYELNVANAGSVMAKAPYEIVLMDASARLQRAQCYGTFVHASYEKDYTEYPWRYHSSTYEHFNGFPTPFGKGRLKR